MGLAQARPNKGIIRQGLPSMELKFVNSLTFEEFVEQFGTVFEKSPLIAGSVWSDRPFTNFSSLHESFCNFVRQLPFQGKAGLLRCYPDLAQKHHQQLSAESLNDHKAAGIFEMSDDELQEMTSLNVQYKEKFGWPFVICARENKKQAILDGLKTRLLKSRKEELEAGIEETFKIALHRLEDIVISTS